MSEEKSNTTNPLNNNENITNPSNNKENTTNPPDNKENTTSPPDNNENTTKLSNNNENTTDPPNNNENNPPKKSRTVSNAEKRRARRERKILGDPDSRLRRITVTHNPNLNTLGETSSTLSSPFVSRKSSPQHSQKSSPTSTEAPENPFLPRRRNTGNFEPTSLDGSLNTASERIPPRIRVSSDAEPPDWFGGSLPQNFSQEDNYPTPRFPPTPLTTPVPTTASMIGEDEPEGYFNNQDEYIRQILGNFAGNYQGRNSSTTSLASTIGGSEYQYNPLITAQDEYIQQEILQQQQQQLQQIPFPFQQFFGGSIGQQQQPQLDLQSKLWQFIHFGAMILLGGLIIWNEFLREKGAWYRFYLLNYERPGDIIATGRIPYMRAFWYFITVELILQSSRIFLQQDRVFQGSTLVQFARKLPPPFSEVLTVLLRYNLIWNSLWEDFCVLVFIVGFTVTVAPFLSYFA